MILIHIMPCIIYERMTLEEVKNKTTKKDKVNIRGQHHWEGRGEIKIIMFS